MFYVKHRNKQINNRLNIIYSTISMSTNPVHNDTTIICEGSASMSYKSSNGVFYNKVQVLNRDLSIQVLSLYSEIRKNEVKLKYEQKLISNPDFLNNPASREYFDNKLKGITILDALAASALRSIRYIKEVPFVNKVIVNDIDLSAVNTARENMERNQINHGVYIIIYHY